MTEVQNCIPKDDTYSYIHEIDKRTRSEIKSSGYVVDTFEAAIWSVATTKNYKDCVLKAVNLGGDTDTVGAVAGIIYGYEGILENWIEVLRNKECINNCLF